LRHINGDGTEDGEDEEEEDRGISTKLEIKLVCKHGGSAFVSYHVSNTLTRSR
jgi:hypothetical protein